VFAAGVSKDATVGFGGKQEEYDRGQSNNATVRTGGREVVDSGGVSFLTNLVGGDEEVRNNGVAISTTVTNGMMFVHPGGSVETGLTLLKGTAEIHGSMTGTMFVGSGGDLKLYNLPEFAAAIAGFGKGDLIDLGNFGFSSRTTASFSSGTLTGTDGNHHASLSLSGPYSTSNFALSSDGVHGTLITFA
jgi:autotransporter passenger strand-loop-strand repeat protein